MGNFINYTPLALEIKRILENWDKTGKKKKRFMYQISILEVFIYVWVQLPFLTKSVLATIMVQTDFQLNLIEL